MAGNFQAERLNLEKRLKKKFERNILTLKCDSSAWKQELFLQKKAIIDKCNLLLGKPSVKNILFV